MKSIGFAEALGPLVRSGWKTQTRRVIRPQPVEWHAGLEPRYRPGEVVYVKEPWCGGQHGMSVQYRDDWTPHDYGPSWRSAASMPASSARTFLRILDVRAERLQEISEEDAMREGSVAQFSSVHGLPRLDGYGLRCVGLKPIPMQGFMALWDSLAKPGERWDDKPWVWVYTYELTEAP